MIQLTFKAKHFYFIAFHLRNASIEQSYSLISKIKTALAGNTDLEADTVLLTTISEVSSIYKVLTVLPEGIANTFNSEMSDLLQAQVVTGVTNEITNGLGPDTDGSVPADAYWQILAAVLSGLKAENTAKRNIVVTEGKRLIDNL